MDLDPTVQNSLSESISLLFLDRNYGLSVCGLFTVCGKERRDVHTVCGFIKVLSESWKKKKSFCISIYIVCQD